MGHFLKLTISNDNSVSPTKKAISLFRTFTVCSKICNHPDIIYDILQKGDDNEEIDADKDEYKDKGKGKGKGKRQCKGKYKGRDKEKDIDKDQGKGVDLFSYSWAKKLFRNYKTGQLSNSSKMVMLFDIIKETLKNGDKLLIFSQWLISF